MTAYFAFHAFQGDSGLGALKRLERQIAEVQVIAQTVSSERAILEHRISMLDDASIDPDMLEEKVREKLGFVHPDEIILFVDTSTIN